MSSTGSGERSDQIPLRGRGMTAYQKEKSKASPHRRPPRAGHRASRERWGQKARKINKENRINNGRAAAGGSLRNAAWGEEKACREGRKKEPSIIPKAHGQGSLCFTLDCTAQDSKGNWEVKRESSITEATLCCAAQRMEGRSQEDGGKKPSLVVALAPAQKHRGKYFFKNLKKYTSKKGENAPPTSWKYQTTFRKAQRRKTIQSGGQQKEVAGDFDVIGVG